MRKKRTVADVARSFAEYVNRVAFHGERFLLIRGRKPVAELSPVPRAGGAAGVAGIAAATDPGGG